MSLSIRSTLTSWTTLVPVTAMVVLATAWGREVDGVLVALVTVLLAGAVLAAVHHAEVGCQHATEIPLMSLRVPPPVSQDQV